MKIWLLRSNEIMPINGNNRFMRMGMLADELVKDSSNDVTWFCSSFDHYKKVQYFNENTTVDVSSNLHLKFIYAKGYKTNISLRRAINHWLTARRLRKAMKNSPKPDIIVVSLPTIEFSYEACRYGEKNNVPVIVDVRDLWPDSFKQNLQGFLRLAATPYIKTMDRKAKYTLSHCYKITSITDLMLDWGLNKANRRKTKLDRAFYIGYRKDKIKEDIDVKDIMGNTFNLGFFATINNQFNYELICELGKALENENVSIIICGDGPKFKYFEEACRDIKSIKLLGWCESDKLRVILRKCDIGFAPYNDTFDFQRSVSNKFCEYLSCGLPIVITSSGYMKEIIDKNKVGISSSNVEEIKRFILDLRDNPKKKKTMSTNAIDLYNKNFDADKIYPKMVKYIKDVWEEYNK